MSSGDVDSIVLGFRDLTLPKPAWTHEAHLIVCWATLRQSSVAEAIDHLRGAIRAYNEATNTPNTDTGGYHETITRYYVGAVAHAAVGSVDELVTHPLCSRTAALDFWSKDRLMSVEGRLGWVEPDLAPLPFTLPPA
jgi:hypothetical protein